VLELQKLVGVVLLMADEIGQVLLELALMVEWVKLVI